MKIKITVILMYSLLFGMIFPVLQPAESKTLLTGKTPDIGKKTAPPKAQFALLVGINDYLTIRDLSGCENDVRLMRGVLAELYGFKPGNEIKELLSSSPKAAQPTQKIILDSFDKHLIANAKKYAEDNKLSPDKGATIVFYYSGHGSYLPDQAGTNEEADGQDETIVPMDSDTDGSRDIRDDEIDKRFAELRKYTTNITFIFDSCNSGTITRGKGTRSIPRLSKDAAKKNNGEGESLNETMDSLSQSYVTISGSLPDELSQEDQLPVSKLTIEKLKLVNYFPNIKAGEDRQNGLLTYYLVQELINTPDATYRDILRRVRVAVTKKNADQHPQIEGDIDRTFLGSSASRGTRAITINEVKTEVKDGKTFTTLTIEAGRIVGAYPGGSVGIYDAKARELAGDTDRLAEGEIIASDDFTATVRVIDREIPPTAKIVLATPYFGDNKRTVALDQTPAKNVAASADAGVKMINELAEKLKENQYVQPAILAPAQRIALFNLNQTGAKPAWSVAVLRMSYKDFKLGNKQAAVKDIKVPKDDDEGYVLSSPNGKPLYNFWIEVSTANAADEIIKALEKFVRVDNLRTLGNAASEINKGLEIKLIKLKSWDRPPVGSNVCAAVEFDEEERKTDDYLASKLNPGDYFYFEIINKTGESLFPYIYTIGTGGEIKALYKPQADGDILPGGNTLKTLGARKCSGLFRATAPFGTETFKVIATSQRFDANLLEQPAIAKTVMTNKGRGSALDKLFAQAGINKRTDEVSVPFNGWATTSIDVEIKEK